EAAPQRLAGAQENRPDGKVQIIDQARLEILPDRGDTAPDAHVRAACRRSRLLERCMDALGHEVELRATRHPQNLPWVMRQHEDRRVVRRLLAPPAFPAFVRPW